MGGDCGVSVTGRAVLVAQQRGCWWAGGYLWLHPASWWVGGYLWLHPASWRTQNPFCTPHTRTLTHVAWSMATPQQHRAGPAARASRQQHVVATFGVLCASTPRARSR